MDSSAQGEESILEWFDRSVEKELRKRRDSRSPAGLPAVTLSPSPRRASSPKEVSEKIAGTTASRIEIASQLANQVDSELSEAVDKLAAAEAICSFSGAVEAAEEAAEHAPADLVEEYAVAGAREYQTVITGAVQGAVPGYRPIEVVGYVGITVPKYPKPSSRFM